MNEGLLLLRTVVGLTLAAHGAQKLFGWFGGPGLEGTARGLEMLGFSPGRRRCGDGGAGGDRRRFAARARPAHADRRGARPPR